MFSLIEAHRNVSEKIGTSLLLHENVAAVAIDWKKILDNFSQWSRGSLTTTMEAARNEERGGGGRGYYPSSAKREVYSSDSSFVDAATERGRRSAQLGGERQAGDLCSSSRLSLLPEVPGHTAGSQGQSAGDPPTQWGRLPTTTSTME